MSEFFTVKRIDNSRLVRPLQPNRMRECARLILLGGMLALCALLYAWQHFETIQLRYQLESLRGEAAGENADLVRDLSPGPGLPDAQVLFPERRPVGPHFRLVQQQVRKGVGLFRHGFLLGRAPPQTVPAVPAGESYSR